MTGPGIFEASRAGRGLPFLKMHGLGNDFVIFDARGAAFQPRPEEVRRIADRHEGVGCDQLIVIEPSARADLFMRIFNADGQEVAACGNATRCLAWLAHKEDGKEHVVIETRAGLLEAAASGPGRAMAELGRPGLSWREIPLARAMDTRALDLDLSDLGPLAAGLEKPSAVSMGNPHCIFFVEDADARDLETIGARAGSDPLFPEGANVSLAMVRPSGAIRLRVYERGAGVTQACGSAAAASVVAAHRFGLAARRASVILDGGPLAVEWRADDRVTIEGLVALSFRGVVDPSLLETAAAPPAERAAS